MSENIINTENEIKNLNEQPSEGKQINFAMILHRRRWSIIIVTVLFVAAAIIYLIKAEPIYTSTSRLYVEQTGPKLITEYEGVMTQSKNYLYTQSEVIKSTPIISEVVQKADIKNMKTLEAKSLSAVEKFKNLIGLGEPTFDVGEIDNLVIYLKKNINVQVGIKDDIIAVNCSSPYRQEAAKIVNAIVETYVNYQMNQKKSTVSEVLKILQNEKVTRDKELSDNFQQLLDFTKKYGVVSMEKNGGNEVFQRLKTLGESLTNAQLETIKAKANLEAVKKIDSSQKIRQYAMAQPNISSNLFTKDKETELRDELKDLEIQLQNILTQCAPDHPTAKALKNRIETVQSRLDSQIDEFAKNYVEFLQIEYDAAKQKEAELLTSYDQYKNDAQSLNVKATEYTILETKLDQSKRFCEILDNRIKELNVSEEAGALNISILEAARPAEQPTSPKKAATLAVSLILGLICGTGFASVKDKLDWRLRSTEEISTILAVPVLGVVPSMPSAKGKKDVTGNGQKVQLEPRSSIAEAYRTIRTAVFFGVPKGQARTILITSPSPSDGKTTMVSNLAITMAQAGQKTLIVDADFRKPMQHNIFGFANEVEKGLSSILSGQITLDNAIRNCPTDGLFLLTSGPEIPNPSELLNSEAFSNLLKELTHRYDRIIIDSPPITSVADSQILAALCDITILVIRAEKTTRKTAEHAREALAGIGARVLGAVVNDVSPRHSRYGYYSHYGYYGYGYGYGKKKE
jgi:capsular exopolysaccharide synthesis family protein